MESPKEMDKDILISLLSEIQDYLEMEYVDEYVSHGTILSYYSEYLLLIAINQFLKEKK
jgi:hypothetical protein